MHILHKVYLRHLIILIIFMSRPVFIVLTKQALSHLPTEIGELYSVLDPAMLTSSITFQSPK